MTDGRPDLLTQLTLERIDPNLFRSVVIDPQDYTHLYGGLVAAQALRAAADTVEPGRVPHSLHSYFLRRGDPGAQVVFHVDRDRDGRSFSARRVTALQDGKVIFNLSVSFHRWVPGPDTQRPAPPQVEDPDALPVSDRASYLASIECRLPRQDWPLDQIRVPQRAWLRCTLPLGEDPVLHACVLTYVSDAFNGVAPLATGTTRARASLDHAMWFHRPVQMDAWVLMDLCPQSLAGGRGMYTGNVYDQSGSLVAALAQEMVLDGTGGPDITP
ncbi:MAG TPA: acyl-CoA thioesterase domain-containing protein [Mycobacteriales bacterium]|nr:acyl-CoA thioesterase domain-containing protein [Mycobacteriales bacterium]